MWWKIIYGSLWASYKLVTWYFGIKNVPKKIAQLKKYVGAISSMPPPMWRLGVETEGGINLLYGGEVITPKWIVPPFPSALALVRHGGEHRRGYQAKYVSKKRHQIQKDIMYQSMAYLQKFFLSQTINIQENIYIPFSKGQQFAFFPWALVISCLKLANICGMKNMECKKFIF